MKTSVGAQRFEAPIIAGRGGGAFVRVPFSVPDVFGTRGQLRVKGTIDGHRDARGDWQSDRRAGRGGPRA